MANTSAIPRTRSLLALLLVAACSSGRAMQLATPKPRSNLLQLFSRGQPQACAPLKNMGSHSTVLIGVGTPPQFFNVVADTGSDSVIVTSCVCEDNGRCSKENKCFRGGNNRSSTFKLATLPASMAATGTTYPDDSSEPQPPQQTASNSASGSSEDQQLEVVSLTFGSGPIQALLATDYVQVGSVRTLMPDGVLLMIDQALNIEGPFEGILGLGLPRSGSSQPAPQSSSSIEGANGSHTLAMQMPLGFLEQAGVSRFSICFNDGADGVLRLGVPPGQSPLASIGTAHWGLDFRGISVGSGEPAQAIFCTETELAAGQRTACGAIPDSGTTVLMGPPAHIRGLFNSLCDEWPRCATLAEKNPKVDKSDVFQTLLYNCTNWLSEKGLGELPDIYFHVAGAAGAVQSLKMSGYGYIMQSKQPEVRSVLKYLMGVFPVIEEIPTGRMVDVCVPAFGTMNFHTQLNGPVWILGTPLFYDFQVTYDLKATPPTVNFDSTPCGSCSEEVATDAPSLLVESRQEGRLRKGIRRLTGPIRVPSFDTSQPL